MIQSATMNSLRQLLNQQELAAAVERDTAALAASMKAIHGGDYRVQIDHEACFALVVMKSAAPK